MKQKAALALVQSAAPFNLFKNDLWQSLLMDLLMKSKDLSEAQKNKLVKDLGNERQMASKVQKNALVFKDVR